MSNVLLTTDIKIDRTAGMKARVDVMNILRNSGYKVCNFPAFKNFRTFRNFWLQLSSLAFAGDHIVVEYPVWEKRRIFLLYIFARIHKIKCFAILHDVYSLRNERSPVKDIATLKFFDGLISHNPSLTKWLRSHGITKKIIELNVFDYLVTGNISAVDKRIQKPFSILYAGNLSPGKAGYVYKELIDPYCNFRISLYGPYFEEDRLRSANFFYKGSFHPNNPFFKEQFHFGLIWEGDGPETCSGNMGNYLCYNSPHKTSLYMALALPIIVWSKAAIAPFVLKNNIGFTIDSLTELGEKLANVKAYEFEQWRSNISILSVRTRQGYYLQNALAELTNIFHYKVIQKIKSPLNINL